MNTTYIHLAAIAAFLAPWTAHALTSTMVEAEACSDRSPEVVISTEHFPYIGSGYLDYAGQGSYAEWNNVTVPAAGTYTLLVRYANGASGSNRSCDLTINGQDRGTVDFPCVYTDWSKQYIARATVELDAGVNTIRLTAATSAGGPNIDNIAVTENGLAAPEGPLFSITDYGAVGNGSTDNTVAIQNTIDACSAGGTVVVPAGTFMSGHIKLKSDMTLWLSEGAVLKAIQNNDLFPATLPDTDNANVSIDGRLGGGGWELRRSFVWADQVENLTIRGGGTIDGNGDCALWDHTKDEIERPMPLYITCSDNVVVRNIQIQDAAMWDLVFLECIGVAVDGIIIHSVFGVNKDGIDICDSHDVTIANSAIWCEDDAICPKSGSQMGIDNLTVKNVSLVTTGNLIKFGTLSYGSFSNAVFEDISMQNGLVGICIQVIDGADVGNITYNRIRMNNQATPVYMMHGGGIRDHRPSSAPAKKGSLSNISISDVEARNVRYATGSIISGTSIDGVTYRPMDIALSNVVVNSFKGGRTTLPAEPPEYNGAYPEVGQWGDLPAWGYYVRHAENVTFSSCSETASPSDVRPARVFTDVVENWSDKTGTLADIMAGAFSSAFYVQNGSSGYFKNTQTDGITYFWGQAEMIETVIDAYEWSGDETYLAMSTNLLNGFIQNNGSYWSYNMYNDDIIWAVLAFVRVAEHTGNSYYADVAKSNFDMCYARAWDETYGGGIYWTTDNRSKNACANANTAIAAYMLYEMYGDSAYLDKANAVYDWERATLFNADSGAIYDNIGSGGISTWSSTYNQGTFIGAAHFLGHTEDAKLAAYYTMTRLCSSGILPQYGIAGNNSGFNAIFLRWMNRFIKDRDLQDQYGPWLKKNAVAAWNVRRADNLSWCQWREPSPADINFYAWDCISSYSALFAFDPTPVPSALPVPRYAVGSWPLDGTADDVSGNAHDGIVNNVTWSSDGRVDGCLTFNGVNSSLQVTNNLCNDFSIAFWVKTTQETSGSKWYNGTGLVDADEPYTGDDFGTALLNGRFAFGIGNPDMSIQSSSVINDGSWHHCVATRKQASGTIRVYVDGRLEASGMGSRNTLDDPKRLRFGVTGSHYFNGSLDEVQVFTRTLGSDEVAALYHSRNESPLAAPFNLHAVAGNGQVQLDWSDAAGATSYTIKRSLVIGGPYTPVATVSDTTFVDSGLANNRTYYYVVAGANAVGEGEESDEINATPTALVIWLKADSISDQGDGSPLAVWPDSSGNGRDAIQSMNARQPTVVTDGINGRPVVRFDAADESCMWMDRSVQDDFTLVLVYRSSQGIGTGTAFYSGAGLISGEMPGVVNDFGVSLNAAGRVLAGTGSPDTSIQSATGFNDGQPHVISFMRTKSTGSIRLYVDGSLVSGTGGTQALSSSTALLLGANPALNNFLSGDMAEVRMYNTALSSTERVYLERSLKGTYAIPGGGIPGLPSGLTGLAANRKVLLNWTMAPGATSCNLWRSVDGGSTYELIETDLVNTSYVDTTAVGGRENLYRLAGVNDSGTGAQTTPLAVYLPLPGLSFAMSSEAMQMSWPEWADDWTLYGATNLTAPVQWLPVPGSGEFYEGRFNISLPTDSPYHFFRLSYP